MGPSNLQNQVFIELTALFRPYSMIYSGRALVWYVGGRGFNFQLGYTKDLKMVPGSSLLSADRHSKRKGQTKDTWLVYCRL